MAEYRSTTICELIEQIESQEIILPAMQRSFVWPEDKIYHLFDSLMRDYPIGTFLFWNVKHEVFKQYAFNQFIKNVVDSKDKYQRGEEVTENLSKYTAVLDGQQRITALYLGTVGKWETHKKNTRWDIPSNFYDRFLCIDLLFYPSDEEEFLFRFVPKEEIEVITNETSRDGTVIATHYWVEVASVFRGTKKSDGTYEEFDQADYVDDFCTNNPGIIPDGERKTRRKMLETLKNALNEKEAINYYEANNKELSEVIDIFVRTNSGGQKLSASDLMLSIASGTLGTEDVHKKVQAAIGEINESVKDPEHGFKVDKDLILTAGLMLTDAKSLSLNNKQNYERNQMDLIFQSNWDAIVESLSNTVQYIEYLGFDGSKLTSKNLLLPIAYYFYKNNLSSTHKDSGSDRAACDTIFIRQWMLRAIVKNVFLEGTGSTLLRIRDVFDATKEKHFPLKDLMDAKIKNDLDVGDEEISEILDCQYGDARIGAILLELTSSSPDYYHVDHIWPRALMDKKSEIRKKYPTASKETIEYYKTNFNKLANLQLLSKTQNLEKGDTPYGEWVKTHYPDIGGQPNEYFEKKIIPVGISYDYDNFQVFIEEREKLIRDGLKEAFPNDFDGIVKRYSLQNKI